VHRSIHRTNAQDANGDSDDQHHNQNDIRVVKAFIAIIVIIIIARGVIGRVGEVHSRILKSDVW